MTIRISAADMKDLFMVSPNTKPRGGDTDYRKLEIRRENGCLDLDDLAMAIGWLDTYLARVETEGRDPALVSKATARALRAKLQGKVAREESGIMIAEQRALRADKQDRPG